MKFGEFVLSLNHNQYIAWVDHTLPTEKTVIKNGKLVKKYVDPFTKPMRVGNITIDRIGDQTGLYMKDIYGIQSSTEYKGKKIPGGVIFFHVHDREELKIHSAVMDALRIYKKNGWFR